MTDRIEKMVEIKAPVERVWRALTDHREFGAWFRVDLDGPFAAGAPVTGRMTYPGFEHVPFEARVERMESPTAFAFRWSHYDAEIDVSNEPWTLVEFTLAPTEGGTRLKVVESGFAALSPRFRDKALTGNTRGWEMQMENIQRHVEA